MIKIKTAIKVKQEKGQIISDIQLSIISDEPLSPISTISKSYKKEENLSDFKK